MMGKSSELSPGPWRWVTEESGRPDYARDTAGNMIFACLSMEHGEADAAFIVKAVNNHERLVEMVRDLRGMVRVTGPKTDVRERADFLLASLE